MIKKFWACKANIYFSDDAFWLQSIKCKLIKIYFNNVNLRPQIVNVNSDEPIFYRFSIKTSKCCGSCKNINEPYTKMCVPDAVKNLNVKVFDLMSSMERNM